MTDWFFLGRCVPFSAVRKAFLGSITALLFTLGALPATAVTGSLGQKSSGKEHSIPKFDARNFGEPGAALNKWFPLKPGYQSVREGGLDRGRRRLTHRRVYTVTDVSKVINGVRAVVVLDQDIDGGEVAEQALDYLAEDRAGNVWYLGSYTESYESGQFVNAQDAWLAGVRGGRAGIMMLAVPAEGTPEYSQAYVPGEGSATAKVRSTGQKKCVPFRCYTDVLVIEEGGENVFYAAGAGAIKTEPRRKGGENETEQLINLTQLSPQGLAEFSAEALKLDHHAGTTSERVFGATPSATRFAPRK
jgi:hypothetical protein